MQRKILLSVVLVSSLFICAGMLSKKDLSFESDSITPVELGIDVTEQTVEQLKVEQITTEQITTEQITTELSSVEQDRLVFIAENTVQVGGVAEFVKLDDSVDTAVKDVLPTLEDVLYHTWSETTGYDTYVETVSPTMLVGAETYEIDSYEYDGDNMVIYWHTDYMNARLIAYADHDYRYMELNYYVDETASYESDTLYFTR